MIFLLTWDGALKWRFLFFLREEVTILLNFILKACKLSTERNLKYTLKEYREKKLMELQYMLE
jgi:hypothetical protein